jgi:hypothetical protein
MTGTVHQLTTKPNNNVVTRGNELSNWGIFFIFNQLYNTLHKLHDGAVAAAR